ncbi:glutaredoxin family protein [Candidatus Njordibacter sp. Uisw_056]|uniref:glutaredoxin family protein n=1 Tax=Candidatus Njordibacter sp. Uisw_056 TaxID=3230973 RepID=UPI003D591B25
MPKPKRYMQLLGTSGCHLCDQAEALLGQCLDLSQVEVEMVDIADTDELVALYGEKIPVLRCIDSQKVLCWPFDERTVSCF